MLAFSGTTLYAINRLDDSIVFSQSIVDPGTRILGICADLKVHVLGVYGQRDL